MKPRSASVESPSTPPRGHSRGGEHAGVIFDWLGRAPVWAVAVVGGAVYAPVRMLLGGWNLDTSWETLAVGFVVWLTARLVRNVGEATQLLAAGTDAVVAVDADQRIVVFNEAAETVFGYRHDEVVGHGLAMLLPSRFRESHHSQVEASSSPQTQRRMMSPWREVMGLRSNGEEFPCDVTIGRLRRKGKQLAVAIVRDISERRAAERELRVVEERFRRAFDDAPIGMSVADLDDRILDANHALCEMLGYTREQLCSMKWTEFSHPDDIKENWELNEEIIEAGQGAELSRGSLEKRYIRADGEIIWVEVSVAALQEEDGNPKSTVAHIQDVTARRAAQRELERLVASKNELIASVSHELRTPLTAVLGYAELLREDGHLPPELRAEMVDTIVSQGTDLSNIVEDLLVAAQTEAGTLHVASVSVSLRAQAAQVLETIARGSATPAEVLGECPSAIGDPSRVRQILRNLISNAVRYGGDEIRVELGQSGPMPWVRVVDDGPAISEHESEAIFEPFHRTDKAPMGVAPVGIGLSVSRELARMMGGDLSYRYESGHSVFQLTLPPVLRKVRPSVDQQVLADPGADESDTGALTGTERG